MKAIVCSLALMIVGCGSETDKAIAGQVSDSPEEAPEFKPDPNATMPTSNAPYTDTKPFQTNTTTPVVAATPTPRPVVRTTQPTEAPKTPELEYLLNQEIYQEWTSDEKLAYYDGCMSTATDVLAYSQAEKYCMCAMIVSEALSGGDVREYVANMSTYNSAFRDIGAPEYCVAIAKGAKP